MRWSESGFYGCLLVLASGCSGTPAMEPDAGAIDAGSIVDDAGTMTEDAAAPLDAGSPIDASVAMDAGSACEGGCGDNAECDTEAGSCECLDGFFDEDGDGDCEPPALELTESDPPVAVPDGTRFFADVACGPHERNVFDVFLPRSGLPTPLVLYVHGGGFISGDKSNAYSSGNADDIEAILESGAAFAAINYRYLEEGVTDGVLDPMGDSARCLQFMRHHASSLNIDPDLVAGYGASAGAGTVLWLGTHDDMADPASADPIARQSTRLVAVGLNSTQATYDLVRWEEVLAPYGFDLTIAAAASSTLREFILVFYGVDDLGRLDDADMVAYRASVDMLGLMDASDAPVWLSTTLPDDPPTSSSLLLHHPLHARAVRDRAEDVGVEHSAHIPAFDIDEPGGNRTSFLLRHLGLP